MSSDTDKPSSAFNLPYNQAPYYWIAVSYVTQPGLKMGLAELGMKSYKALENTYMKRVPAPWGEAWKKLYAVLEEQAALDVAQVAVLPGEEDPDLREIIFSRKPPATIMTLAEGLWLGQALLEDRVLCYMQPVLDKRRKVFGYEAFARVESDKEVIGGGKIIKAGKDLNIEYQLDRHLHVKAIKSFISSELEGFLFINFLPGFIHRPEKYLEGLTDAVKLYNMPSKQIVLDVTQSETSQDLQHLKSIVDYCRSKGYSLALDDIASVSAAKKIFETIRPDFIKLDINLVKKAQSVLEQNTIKELVSLAHASGAAVLAEGVETEEVHQELMKADVDLFQGYLFSPPVAVTELKKVAG